MDTLNPRLQTILRVLASGASSSGILADVVGAPVPSIRRNIQRLRDLGYDIKFENGFYTHVTSNTQQTTDTPSDATL